MGAFLGLFTGGLPFGGAIIALIGVAFGGFWGYERIQISGLNSEIAKLHCQIDGPTQNPPCKGNGYIVQLGRANANYTQAKDNAAMLQGALMADEMAVAQWRARADMASQQATVAQAAADKAAMAGQQQATAILNAMAKGDVCTAALDLIHGVALP